MVFWTLNGFECPKLGGSVRGGSERQPNIDFFAYDLAAPMRVVWLQSTPNIAFIATYQQLSRLSLGPCMDLEVQVGALAREICLVDSTVQVMGP